MRHTQILAISALGMLLAIGCTKAETPVDAAVKPVAVVNGTPYFARRLEPLREDAPWRQDARRSDGRRAEGGA